MFTESDRKLEVIQRAQVSSLMGADRNKESQEKTPERQSPTLATRPKRYALELWVEIKTSAGGYYQPHLPWVCWHVPGHGWPYVGLLWKEDQP